MVALFKKNIPVSCEYCKYGYVMSNETDCICEKLGVLRIPDRCNSFLYNPLKRKPSKNNISIERQLSEQIDIFEKTTDLSDIY